MKNISISLKLLIGQGLLSTINTTILVCYIHHSEEQQHLPSA